MSVDINKLEELVHKLLTENHLKNVELEEQFQKIERLKFRVDQLYAVNKHQVQRNKDINKVIEMHRIHRK